MTGALLAVVCAVGVYLLYSAAFPATVLDRKPAPVFAGLRQRAVNHELAALDLRIWTIAAPLALVGGALGGWLAFGGVLAPLLLGALAGSLPPTVARQRRREAKKTAAEAWPNLIEEIRLHCGALGQPVPQALLETGKSGPRDMAGAFAHAEREWLLTTDFERTLGVLRRELDDPTADTVCETLLVAHSVGGTDVERRLATLASDRRDDLHLRKDAKAKQAGVRFARRFVLVVPVGMALVGMSIGNGRDSYASSTGQIGVAFAILVLAACWFWAGRLIALPQAKRVLVD